MRRKIYEKLLSWKNDKSKKPLILLGARQVGKTYIINEFCKNEYKNVIAINLLEYREVVELYKEPTNSEDKFRKLKAILNNDFDSEDSVIFFDEIQESEELISNLKFFCEKHSDLNIICAGSLLGVKLKRSKFSFPVGKVTMINMYPMDYEEFLMAFDKDILIDEIKTCYQSNKQLSMPLHNIALDYYRLFLCVGGMPESVQSIVESDKDVTKYKQNILDNILESYFDDMNKYVINNSEAVKIESVYKSLPTQLSNKSNKFQYGKISKNAKSRDYDLPISWLVASRLIIKSNQVSTPEIPLRGFVKNNYFKLFLSDVGILTKMLNLKYGDIIIDNLSLYKGVITENYVANQFVINNFDLFYWMSDGKAEIDFLIYTDDGIIPVEVKASDSVKSKSLIVYTEKYKPKYSIRISSRNFGFVNNIKSIPLYAVFCIK